MVVCINKQQDVCRVEVLSTTTKMKTVSKDPLPYVRGQKEKEKETLKKYIVTK